MKIWIYQEKILGGGGGEEEEYIYLCTQGSRLINGIVPKNPPPIGTQ